MDQLIKWLLEGDVAIQYQVHRDLLGIEKPALQNRIATEGWGAKFLECRKRQGHWGQRFYQPKWISTHYTILDLKNLCISPNNHLIRASISQVLETLKGSDGGISPFGAEQKCDVCVNGMFLNYASYFGMTAAALKSIIDFLLTEHMQDGGFNCNSNFKGATHSSVHSSISVLEGIREYSNSGYSYRLEELQEVERDCVEFLLKHKLFRSHRTGEIIDRKMLMLSYPSRWKYDILRALDYLQAAGISYDPRMQDALDILEKKRLRNGRWPVQSKHPGQTHFDMEKTGQASRWNTLRALRVLKHFDQK
ncbi:MAG: hypothetical protein HOD43_12230 [Candidatus Marinimicrobia bacterium]|jgi:hypothetical protein|nr:hypothetical protein [Candidatus Neomarinimicrobiota bacterium]MBT3632449.1 hypothetical protein [Candidatus Neomarinimicrobiota bacterium]MBT3826036.1 hypothetical protein [Candidatus Neomarinimicrobiota bacterium]MBT4132272.1 hypothetical protein [Candidatus Neomarinimicrobiota bacterium]MBT4296557.1 hypothetical protein [Candidatus Neomarinimicrobiota bacterium]